MQTETAGAVVKRECRVRRQRQQICPVVCGVGHDDDAVLVDERVHVAGEGYVAVRDDGVRKSLLTRPGDTVGDGTIETRGRLGDARHQP